MPEQELDLVSLSTSSFSRIVYNQESYYPVQETKQEAQFLGFDRTWVVQIRFESLTQEVETENGTKMVDQVGKNPYLP